MEKTIQIKPRDTMASISIKEMRLGFLVRNSRDSLFESTVGTVKMPWGRSTSFHRGGALRCLRAGRSGRARSTGEQKVLPMASDWLPPAPP